MQPASQDQIKRAVDAIETAPRTESGLIIPPHVAAEREQEAALEQPRPNRAERRWQEKQARRARRKKRPPAELEALAKGMNETQLIAAVGSIRDATAAGALAREALQDQHEGGRL